MGLRNEMKNGADTHFVKGFVVESGVIQPVEAVVKDLVTDCLEVQSDEETLCWHEKFLGLFKDSCLYCNSPCEAYNKEKPVYGKLVSLKRLDDTNQFIQQNIALQKKLYEIYEDIPSTTCTNCGECCGGVGFDVDLSTLEYFHLLEYINKRFSEADLKRFKGLCGMNTALEKRDLKDQVRCVFRDIKNRKCNIYDLRPLVCRTHKCDKIEWVGDLLLTDEIDKYEKAYSLSDNLLIIHGEEIIISKKNEMNRWFLL